MSLGVLGVLLGGWTTDAFVRRGYEDGPFRVGIIGGLGMLVCATAFPLMPTPTLAVVVLAILNIFAASPWGAASAALAAVTPAPLRAQAAALFFMAVSIVGGMGGPIVVAQLTDHVFGAPNIRYSISVLAVGGMTLAVSLLVAGLDSFRKTIERLVSDI